MKIHILQCRWMICWIFKAAYIIYSKFGSSIDRYKNWLYTKITFGWML